MTLKLFEIIWQMIIIMNSIHFCLQVTITSQLKTTNRVKLVQLFFLTYSLGQLIFAEVNKRTEISCV